MAKRKKTQMCPEVLSGPHVPESVDLDTVDDEEIVLSFVCEACGRSGTLTVSLDDIDWEEDDEDLEPEDDF